MTAVSFNIPGWKAWSAEQADVQPDVSVIPAMLRRRLSVVGRAALSVIIPLMETHGAMPLVYVSRHGDLNRTLGLLEDLARAEPLSPTAFSLSVHNAIAGLFSIHRGLTANITAMSGGTHELIPALLETLGLCQQNAGPVLCVFCDEPPPALYQAYVDQPAYAYALALVIAPGDEWQLAPVAARAGSAGNHQVQALEFLDMLQGEGKGVFASNGGHWSIQRRTS